MGLIEWFYKTLNFILTNNRGFDEPAHFYTTWNRGQSSDNTSVIIAFLTNVYANMQVNNYAKFLIGGIEIQKQLSLFKLTEAIFKCVIMAYRKINNA